MGDPFTLRGVEARVSGRLARRGKEVTLEITGTGERLVLGPLGRKVQWDRTSRKEQPATPAEKAAYKNLTSGWDGKPQAVQVVGPLVPRREGKPLLLEVREFTRIPKPSPPAEDR